MSVQLTTQIRPLTPPHNLEGEIETALKFLSQDVTAHITPPNSSPFRSPHRLSKRVEFHLTPTVLATPDRRDERIHPKPKSILKTSSPLPTPDEANTPSYFQYQPGPKMLDSAVQHLDGSRDVKLDAYLAINGALSDYEELPSLDQWRQYLRALQQHVLRDVRTGEIHDSLATNISTQAIKLAAYMSSNEQVVKLLDVDFQSSLLDRIIILLNDSSKQISKSALGFLSSQRLAGSVFTASRTDRVLSVLHQLENKSRGVVIARLQTYKRLIDQVPSLMLTGMQFWLPDMLNGMLSDLTETRQRAIDLGLQGTFAFGKHARATEVLHNVLETTDGTNYFENFVRSLDSMLEKAGQHIPQIWTVIILFQRCRKLPLYQWRRFRPWLVVLQKCMNCPDLQTREQASLAWRRLIYVIQPDTDTPSRVHTLLKEPIRIGFARTSADKAAKQARHLAIDLFYNLLHYALRPGLHHQELDFAWDTYVMELLQPMISASSKGRTVACGVLAGLLTPNTGSWNADAALEEAAILPQDLPQLDPRWVRARVGKILSLVEPILQRTLDAPEPHHAPSWHVAMSLLRTLSEASGQEVKCSTDSKAALASLLTTCRRLWFTIESQPGYARLGALVTLVLKQLPSLTENLFFIDSQGTLTIQTQGSPSSSALTYLLSFAANNKSQQVLQGIVGNAVPNNYLSLAFDNFVAISMDCNKLAAWSILADLAAAGLEDVADESSDALCTSGRLLFLAGTSSLELARLIYQPAYHRLTSALSIALSCFHTAGFFRLLVEPFAGQVLQSNMLHSSEQQACLPLITSSLTIMLTRASGLVFQSCCHDHALPSLETALRTISQLWYSSPSPQWHLIVRMLRSLLALVGPQSTPFCTGFLQSSFIPWIQDTSLVAPAMLSTDEGELKWSSIMSEALTKLLTLDLDATRPLLLAALSSTIPEVVEVAVSYWNVNFSKLASDLDSELLRVLEGLNPALPVVLSADHEPVQTVDAADLAICASSALAVARSESHDRQDVALDGLQPSSLAAVVDDFDQTLTTEHADARPNITPAGPSSPAIAHTSPAHEATASNDNDEGMASDEVDVPYQHSTPTIRSKRSADKSLERQRRKKRRHNDSQLDFVSIPSIAQAESQLFTEHQRDVREQQHVDAGQYLKLSSSPVVLFGQQRIDVQSPKLPSSPAILQSSPSSDPSPSQRSLRRRKRKSKKHKTIQEADPGSQLQAEAEAAYRASQSSQLSRDDVGEEIVVAGSQSRSSPTVIRESFAAPEDIFSRLRQVLADLNEAEISAREERDLDDLLFDIRCANHEAAKRSRS